MHWLPLILLCVAGWIALVLLVHRALERLAAVSPLDTPVLNLLWLYSRLHCRLLHRVRYEGLEHVPATRRPGPLIVIANHTAGVDPLLIQLGCPFKVRWMMARETMLGPLDWLWRGLQIIPVDRDGRDAAALRQAIRHVRDGGVLGLFPEGRIVHPPGELRPFAPGIGIIIARCRAPVLLVAISGTPITESSFGSLFVPGRAVVRFIQCVDFSELESMEPERIPDDLRRRLAKATGWPVNDQPMPPIHAKAQAAAEVDTVH